MRTSFATHNHTARVDTHRVQLMDLDAAQSCAEEGGRMRQASAEADAPDLYAPAPRIPRDNEPAPWELSSWIGPLLGFLSLLVVALVAAASLVWP